MGRIVPSGKDGLGSFFSKQSDSRDTKVPPKQIIDSEIQPCDESSKYSLLAQRRLTLIKETKHVIFEVRSIQIISVMIFSLVLWATVFSFSGGKPESLQTGRDKPLVANWGTLIEMKYDTLVSRMENSVKGRDGNSFVKTVDKDPEVRLNTVKSVDTMPNNTCVLLSPTHGENSPYGFCRVGDTFPVISWIRLKISETMVANAWMAAIILTPNTKYIPSPTGGRISVITEDMNANKVTQEGRRNLLSACGYPEASNCVETTPEKCIVQTHFMKKSSELEFHRDRYYWCPENEEYVGIEMHRHRFGYFNRVFSDAYIDVPSCDMELTNNEIIIYRDTALAFDAESESGKITVYTQLLILLLPILYASFNVKQLTLSTRKVNASFMDFSYRLGSINFIVPLILLFSYNDLFVVAYGVAHFNTLSWATFMIILRSVLNTILVVILALNTTVKMCNSNLRFDLINKYVGIFIMTLLIAVATATTLYYMEPSLEKGTTCDFKFSEICKNGATCCSETFRFTIGHVMIYSSLVAFGVITWFHTGNVKSFETKMQLKDLTCFERVCLNGAITDVIQDYSREEAIVRDSGHFYSSAITVGWSGFIGVEKLGLIRLKDLYMILFMVIMSEKSLRKRNGSIIVWRANGEFNPFHVDSAQRMYLWHVKAIVGSRPTFYLNDVG